jgi:hypothetical protein
MLTALSLLLSATEVAAACPSLLNGFWQFSSLIVAQSPQATDCVVQFENSRIINLLPPCANPPPDYLRNVVIGPLEAECTLGFTDGNNCIYRGALSGEIGAGSVYCSTGFGTFNLISIL